MCWKNKWLENISESNMLLALGLSPHSDFCIMRTERRMKPRLSWSPKLERWGRGLGELACHPRFLGTDTRNARGLECWKNLSLYHLFTVNVWDPCLACKWKKFLLVLCPGPTAFWSSSVLIRGQAQQVQQTISFAVSAKDLKKKIRQIDFLSDQCVDYHNNDKSFPEIWKQKNRTLLRSQSRGSILSGKHQTHGRTMKCPSPEGMSRFSQRWSMNLTVKMDQ